MTVAIDARGLRCPWPALRLARAMRESGADEFTIAADDPNAGAEIARVAEAAGAAFETLAEGEFRIRRRLQ